MKRALMTLVIVASVFVCNAQDKKVVFSAGPVISSPTGNYGSSHGVGIGAEIQATYPIESGIEAFAQAGYQSFSGKSVVHAGYTDQYGVYHQPENITYSSVGHIPFLIGARYFQEGGLIGGLGIGFGNYSFGDNIGSQSGFTFSPQIGYNISKFDLLLHFTSSSITGGSASYFGIKAYYKF